MQATLRLEDHWLVQYIDTNCVGHPENVILIFLSIEFNMTGSNAYVKIMKTL